MPIECLRCANLSLDESVQKCPACGSNEIRFSLLAGVEVPDQDDEFVETEAKKSEMPTIGARVSQFLASLICFHVIAYAVAAVFMVSLAVIHKSKLPTLAETQPLFFLAGSYVVPLFAVAATTLTYCYGIYLAQLIGASVGAVGCIAFLAERSALANSPSWTPGFLEWVVLPPCGMVLGLTCGLLVTGKYTPQVDDKSIQYKPFNSWNKKAKPGFTELENRSVSFRWNRLLGGIISGVMIPPLSLGILAGLANIGVKDVDSARAAVIPVELPFYVLGFLAAGVIAGSGTRFGIFQGFLAGLSVSALIATYKLPPNKFEFLIQMGGGVIVATIGGYIGRKIFPPHRVFFGQHEDHTPQRLDYRAAAKK